MLDTAVREFIAGPLCILVEQRHTPHDSGPTLRVFGRIGEQSREVLRFDCFHQEPHYHYDPAGKDERHHMANEGIDDPVEWTLHRLERDLAEMIRRAGYGWLAEQLDAGRLAEQLPLIREAMVLA